MNTISITADERKAAQYAIDMLTKAASTEDDIAVGIGVLRDKIAEGATIAILSSLTGRSDSAIGRVRTVVTLSTLLDSDLPGAGILRANSAVNAANKLKGLNLTKKHVNVWVKDGRRFGSWNAIADAIEALVKGATTEADEKKKQSDKTETERFADLIAAVSAHARRFDLSEHDVATRIFDHFDKSAAEVADEAADEAADAAELAS